MKSDACSGMNTEINNLKSSVSNGKATVASAITDKGVSTSATDTFSKMAENINNIKSSKWEAATILYTGYDYGNNTFLVDEKYYYIEKDIIYGITPRNNYTRITFRYIENFPGGTYSGGRGLYWSTELSLEDDLNINSVYGLITQYTFNQLKDIIINNGTYYDWSHNISQGLNGGMTSYYITPYDSYTITFCAIN